MRIHYYLHLISQFFKLSLLLNLAYRLNGWMSVLRVGLQVILINVFLEVVFSRTAAVGDWGKYELFIFYGVALLANTIFQTFFGSNLHTFSDLLDDGSFDLVLLKPVHSLFWVSFRRIQIFSLANAALAVAIILYAINKGNFLISISNLLGFITLLLSGLLIYYSVYTLVITLAFWTTRTPFFELLDTLVRVTRYPLDIFSKTWQWVFTIVLPLIFIVTIPVQSLLGKMNYLQILAPLIAIVLLFLATRFWNYAIRFYTSASS